jgi:hypothetical protein
LWSCFTFDLDEPLEDPLDAALAVSPSILPGIPPTLPVPLLSVSWKLELESCISDATPQCSSDSAEKEKHSAWNSPELFKSARVELAVHQKRQFLLES